MERAHGHRVLAARVPQRHGEDTGQSWAVTQLTTRLLTSLPPPIDSCAAQSGVLPLPPTASAAGPLVGAAEHQRTA